MFSPGFPGGSPLCSGNLQEPRKIRTPAAYLWTNAYPGGCGHAMDTPPCIGAPAEIMPVYDDCSRHVDDRASKLIDSEKRKTDVVGRLGSPGR